MNRKPIISLYASGARPENWMRLYDSVKYNSCEFEIVFVGPNIPKIQLPKQFNYIQSFTKPVQCAEIAARNAKGEYLLHCVDDLTFKDKNALDKILVSSSKPTILKDDLIKSAEEIVAPATTPSMSLLSKATRL